MAWLFFIPLQIYIVLSGLRQQEHDGTWSWPMFGFALAFILFDTLIVTLPLLLGMHGNRYFIPVYIAAWIVAALNFVWFLAVCRRWKPRRPNP